MKLFSNKGLTRRVFVLTITVCVLISFKTLTSVQELAKAIPEQPASGKEPTVTERVRLLENELERQNTKLDELQKTIADQQLAIKALLDKLSQGSPNTNGDPCEGLSSDHLIASCWSAIVLEFVDF